MKRRFIFAHTVCGIQLGKWDRVRTSVLHSSLGTQAEGSNITLQLCHLEDMVSLFILKEKISNSMHQPGTDSSHFYLHFSSHIATLYFKRTRKHNFLLAHNQKKTRYIVAIMSSKKHEAEKISKRIKSRWLLSLLKDDQQPCSYYIQ